MRIGRIIFGILGAVGVGAILGVLFAPEKGSVTRAKLSKKTNDIGEDLNAKFTDVVETELKKKSENKHFEHTDDVRMN